MGSVWIVSYWVPEETVIEGVFATEELAKAYLKKRRKEGYDTGSTTITEWEVTRWWNS